MGKTLALLNKESISRPSQSLP